jgi:hypothetical protein
LASSSQIKPGEKGTITAKVEIKGRSGPISKRVQVFSNDPKKPVVNLSIQALIKE